VKLQEIRSPKSSWESKIDSIKAIPSQMWEQGKSCWPFFKKKDEYVVTPAKKEM
jgi:hypothetical protein